MSHKKLHIDAATPDLQNLLRQLGVTYVNGCVLHGTTVGTDPLAVMALRENTATTLAIDVICNRPAAGFVVGDFVITGPVTDADLVGGPQLFRLTLTKTGTGTVSVSLPSGFAQDPDANDFPAVGPLEIELTSRPTPTITGPDEVGFDPVTLSIEFDESVTGLSAGDFEVIDGSLTSLTGTGASYEIDLSVSLGQTDTQVMLPAYRVQNADLRPNFTSNVYAPVVAHVSPTPTITPQRPVHTSLAVIFIMDWSVDVSSEFDEAMLSVVNGEVAEVTQLTSTSYQVYVIADAAGTVTLSISAGEITLPGYAPSEAGEGETEVDLDALTFAVAGPTITNLHEITVTVTGSRSHTGLQRSSFDLTNAVARSWVAAGNGGTLVIVPTDASGQSTITVQIPGGIVQSTEGAYNDPSNILTIVYDSQSPVVSLTQTSVIGSDVAFDLSVSEYVTLTIGYSYPDLATSITGAGLLWRLLITPVDATGELSPVLPAGLFTDMAGNVSAETSLTPYSYDFQGPIGTFTLVPDGHTIDRPTNKAVREFELTFDAPIREELTRDSFELSDDTELLIFAVVIPLTEYLLTVECRATISDVTLTLPAEAATDELLNPMTDDLVVEYAFDSVAPSYLSCVITDRPTYKIWTFTLSEDVTVPDYAPYIVTSGVGITAVDVVGSTVSVTGSPLVSGRIGIKLLRGFAVDLAGNESPETGFFYVLSDVTGPNVVITSPLSPSTHQQLIPVRIEFDEPLSRSLLVSDLAITNARCNPVLWPSTRFAETTANRIYDLIVEAIESGPVSISVPENRVTDPSGNYNTPGTLTIGYAPYFSLMITAEPGDHADQHVLSLSSDNDIVYTDFSADSFLLLGGARRIAHHAGNTFLLTTSPAETSATVVLPTGSIADITGKRNTEAELVLSLTPTTATATLTTDTTEAVVNTDIYVEVNWNVYVERISITQFQADIRSLDLIVEDGSGLVGEFLSFEVIEPGYTYKIMYRATNYPTDTVNSLHIWHEYSDPGTTDLAGRNVLDSGYVSIPLRQPFTAVISSSQYPETIEQLIEFDIQFPALLDVALTLSDLVLINCAVGGSYPSTGFSQPDDNDHYVVTVQALTPGPVTVRLPAAVVEHAESTEPNAETELSVNWLGLHKFLLAINVGPYLRSDQRLLTIIPSLPMDITQIDEPSLVYDDELLVITAFAPGQFLMTLRPGTHTASVIVPEDAYSSYSGSLNRSVSTTFNWALTNLAPRVNIFQPSLIYPNVMSFEIVWPVYVDDFASTDLLATLRDVHLRVVSGFGSEGTLSALTEFVPNYEFRGTFTLTGQPETDLYRFYIWCPAEVCDDIFGDPVGNIGYASVPVSGPFTFLITSPQSPGTSQDVIQFDIRPSRPLTSDIAPVPFDIDNGDIVEDYPGGAFQVVTPLEHYRLYVDPTDKGDVTLTIPAGSFADANGTDNEESLLTVFFDRKFDLVCAITAGSKDDQAVLNITLPVDVDDSQLVNGIIAFDYNKIDSVTKITGEDAFLLQLKLPNGRSSSGTEVNVAVTVIAGTLSATDGAVNRPVTVTGAIPFVPWAMTLISDADVEVGTSVTVQATTNWYTYFKTFPASAGYRSADYDIVFGMRFLDDNTLVWQEDTRVTWSPGFLRSLVTEDEAGYAYSWEQTVTAFRSNTGDGLYVVSPHESNPNGRLGYTLARQWMTDPLQHRIDLVYPMSEATLSWVGGSSLTRYLVVSVSGDNTDKTDAFTVDWGDGDPATTVEFSDALRREDSYAVFSLEIAYADDAEYDVVLTSLDIAIRITGVEISDSDHYLLGVPGPPATPVTDEAAAAVDVQLAYAPDLAKISLGNNALPAITVLQNVPASQSITHLSANMYAADSLLFYGSGGVSDIAGTKFNLEVLNLRTDQNIWTMLAKAQPLPGDTSFTSLETFYGELQQLRITATSDLGTSAIKPFRVTADGIGDAAGRFSVSNLELIGPAFYVVGSNKVNGTAALPHYTVMENGLFTGVLVYDIRTLTYRDRVLPQSIRVTDCLFSNYIIPLNYTRNTGQHYFSLPIREILLLDHRMTKNDELLFYHAIWSFTVSVPNEDQLPLECVVHTRRVAGMYTGPDGNGPMAETLVMIQRIADRLAGLGRPNAFRITAE